MSVLPEFVNWWWCITIFNVILGSEFLCKMFWSLQKLSLSSNFPIWACAGSEESYTFIDRRKHIFLVHSGIPGILIFYSYINRFCHCLGGTPVPHLSCFEGWKDTISPYHDFGWYFKSVSPDLMCSWRQKIRRRPLVLLATTTPLFFNLVKLTIFFFQSDPPFYPSSKLVSVAFFLLSSFTYQIIFFSSSLCNRDCNISRSSHCQNVLNYWAHTRKMSLEMFQISNCFSV